MELNAELMIRDLLGRLNPTTREITEHNYFLRCRFFFCCDSSNLQDEDIALLTRFGSWLEALASGRINPRTELQRAFIEVHNGKAPASSNIELAWKRYQCQRIYERAELACGCLSNGGSYDKVVALYQHAATLGHPKAVAWLAAEEHHIPPSDKLVSLALPEIHEHEVNRIEGGRSQWVATAQAPNTDWTNTIDDKDNAFWERYLGGPDV